MVAEKLTKRDNFIIERVLFNFLFMLLGGNMFCIIVIDLFADVAIRTFAFGFGNENLSFFLMVLFFEPFMLNLVNLVVLLELQLICS